MDLTRVEWRGGMSCEGSFGRAGAGDLGSRWVARHQPVHLQPV